MAQGCFGAGIGKADSWAQGGSLPDGAKKRHGDKGVYGV